MSSLFKQFKMDEMKEQKGILFHPAGANDDGTVPGFRLLRSNGSNQRYTKAVEIETAPHRRQIQLGTLDSKTSNKVFMRVFCNAVLIGWENVYDQNDQPIPHNFNNAMQLFEQLPELYDELYRASNNPALFRTDTAEDDAKNS
jgi:hypothetical protein